MSRRNALLTSLVLFAIPMLSTQMGCAADDDEEVASATATSALQASNHGGVTDGVLDDEAPSAPDPETVAATVAERPARGLQPEGCATKTRAGATVTITLAGCSGPLGKVIMRGTLTATFSRTSDEVLHVDVVGGSDLVANDKPLRYVGQADVRYDGETRHLVYHGESSGETKRGRAFDRKTDMTIVANVTTKCATIDGTSTGTIAGYGLDVTIEGFKGCKDACPTAGLARATVRTPRAKERSLEVRFDGSDHASVTGPKGKTFAVALACADAEAAE